MPVTATFTPARPAFTLSDTLSPATFNGVTLLSGSVVISGALAADGSLAQSGTQVGNWAVAGDGSFGGNLTVAGTSAFTGNVTFAGNLSIAGDVNRLNVTGNAAVAGTLSASGAVSLGTTLVVTGGATIGSLTVNAGNSTLKGVVGVSQTAAAGYFSGTYATTQVQTTFAHAIAVNGDITQGSVRSAYLGSLFAGTTTVNSLRIGSGNTMTAMSAKTVNIGVTLASGATGSYYVEMGAGASGHTGAVANALWPGLRVLEVWPPYNNTSTQVRVVVRNDSGSAMSNSGVSFSAISFLAP